MAFVLWPNTILVVCLGIILSILGYIVYGLIVGFEKTFTEYDDHESQSDAKEES